MSLVKMLRSGRSTDDGLDNIEHDRCIATDALPLPPVEVYVDMDEDRASAFVSEVRRDYMIDEDHLGEIGNEPIYAMASPSPTENEHDLASPVGSISRREPPAYVRAPNSFKVNFLENDDDI